MATPFSKTELLVFTIFSCSNILCSSNEQATSEVQANVATSKAGEEAKTSRDQLMQVLGLANRRKIDHCKKTGKGTQVPPNSKKHPDPQKLPRPAWKVKMHGSKQ